MFLKKLLYSAFFFLFIQSNCIALCFTDKVDFGDSIKTYYDLPKDLKGDSIAFSGLNEIQNDSKLRGTKTQRLDFPFIRIL